MGMYNEVRKTYVYCGALCEIQIPQIVLGFGEFNLNDSNSLRILIYEQLLSLRSYLKDKKFYCNCGNFFFYNTKKMDDKQRLINELTGE